MALIKCPECGQEISDQAEICIHCGFPIKKYLSEQADKEMTEALSEVIEITEDDAADNPNIKEENSALFNDSEAEELFPEDTNTDIETDLSEESVVSQDETSNDKTLSDRTSLTPEKEKRNNRIFAIIVAIVAVIIIAATYVVVRVATRSYDAMDAEDYAAEQFLIDNLDTYLDYVKECGLNDLTAELTLDRANAEVDWTKVDITGTLKFYSNDIDKYYCDRNSSNEDKTRLVELMRAFTTKALELDGRTYTYTLEPYDEINLTVSVDSTKITTLISERTYHHQDSDYLEQVSIGTTSIYYERKSSSSSSGNRASSSSSSSWSTVTDSEDLVGCWALAKDAVKSKLKSPSTAKFPSSYTDPGVKITHSGNSYKVTGWVDAENSFGATVRSNFTVNITKSGSGKSAKWSLVSCTVN